jgi:hypothetical protein
MKAPTATLNERLRRYVRLLKKDDNVSRFLKSIGKNGEPFLFGGAVRDVAFSGKRAVNDLDIFVSGWISEESLVETGSQVRKTNFGGYRLSVGQYDVDVWELERSRAFQWVAPSFISVSGLLKTVCFSTDAIAISLVDGRVIKSPDFSWSFEHDTLAFVAPPSKLDALVATRIARVSLKLGLDLSPIVASYFSKCVETFGSKEIVDAERRWGAKRFLNEIAVEEVRAKILSTVDRATVVLSGGGKIEYR